MQASLERLRQRREELGDEGGFTLIELLIVIVILAILAAIVVFAVLGLTGSAAKVSCASDLQTVDHAAQAYLAQVAKAPTALGSLYATTTGADGQSAGPWLHNTVGNPGHYTLAIGTATGGDGYAITVSSPTNTTGVVYAPGTETTAAACAAAGAG